MKNTQFDDVKRRTLELYDSLPQEKQARMARIDVRDEVIKLNYTFFGAIARDTFINNTSVEYIDKFQSALLHFCECWWWYQWDGDENHKGYRKDVAFTSFFKLRVAEMIERELNEVKYSLRRSLCMKAGAQLGKHWGQVKYEDLSSVNLPADDMMSLKAIFGSIYWADLAEHELYMPAPDEGATDVSKYLTDEYNDLQGLLIHEMVSREAPLTDVDLYQLAELYGVSFAELKKTLPSAMSELYRRLKSGEEMYS